MQALPELLSAKFRELGGELQLSCPVKKIQVKCAKIMGVRLENGQKIATNRVISNCDARQTFTKLLGEKIIGADFANKLKTMMPSLSMMILYLGIDKIFQSLPKPGTNKWVLSHYDLDRTYSAACQGDLKGLGGHMVRLSPDEKTILAFINFPFKNRAFWKKNKQSLIDQFIKEIEFHSLPELSQHIRYREAATPYTLYQYTSNYQGAAYGWAGTPRQFADTDFMRPPFIQGLYLTGHWTTFAQGIPGVTYLGYDTARTVLRRTARNKVPLRKIS